MAEDIEKQYDKIYRYCYFKVKNASVAEDLTQETFLKFLQQNSYRECGKKMEYLYTIARNLCIDSLRTRKELPLEEEVAGKRPMENVELNLSVRQALSMLKEEEQELLLFRYVNDMPVGKIAEFTNQSRFAVYRKTKEALGKLKKQLRKEDFL